MQDILSVAFFIIYIMQIYAAIRLMKLSDFIYIHIH